MSNNPNGLTIAGFVVILIAIAVAVFTPRTDLSMLAASVNGAILGLALVIASRR
jgi:hypothetical protein